MKRCARKKKPKRTKASNLNNIGTENRENWKTKRPEIWEINYNETTKICKTKEQKHKREKKFKRRAESFKTKGHEVRQYDDELTERREQ